MIKMLVATDFHTFGTVAVALFLVLVTWVWQSDYSLPGAYSDGHINASDNM